MHVHNTVVNRYKHCVGLHMHIVKTCYFSANFINPGCKSSFQQSGALHEVCNGCVWMEALRLQERTEGSGHYLVQNVVSVLLLVLVHIP